jgi:hypothetical protein
MKPVIERIQHALANGIYFAIPLVETRTIIQSTSPDLKRQDDTLMPYVRHENIPTDLQEYVTIMSRGSNAPAPGGERGCYWHYDVERWLRGIGIEVEFDAPLR